MGREGREGGQGGSGRADVWAAAGIRLIRMPLAGWGLSIALGLSGDETVVATMISALPTAEDVYNYAATYQRAEIMVRDTVLVTTFASLPIIAAIAWFLQS